MATGRESQTVSTTITANPACAAPAISGILPSSPIANRGNQNVTVTGRNFLPSLTVTVRFPNEQQGTLSGTQILNLTATSFTMVIDFNGNPGFYTIRVNNPGGRSSNDFRFSAQRPSCSTPVIVTQPGSRIVTTGQSATLSVAASGQGPLTYQWYFGSSGDTSNPLPGATSSSFSTPPLLATASYWVRVSNDCGSVISNAGLITVNAPTNLIIEKLDPACESPTNCPGTFLVGDATSGAALNPDPRVLATASVGRSGAVADGVTMLLLRVRSTVPVTFSIKAPIAGPGINWGVLMKRDGSSAGSSVNITPENGLAFALYRTPADFPASFASQSPTIAIEAISSTGGGRTSITLYPPPVVLVHGVWSSSLAWLDLELHLSRSYGYYDRYIARPDYGTINPAGSFDPEVNFLTPNSPMKKLIDSTDQVLRNYRQDGVAVTQADIVGHSMGGLVARSRIALKPEANRYLRRENYFKGDFHKLITVGTPHNGTNIANFLLQHRCDRVADPGKKTSVTLEQLLTGTFRKPLGPAIYGFQTTSLARQHLNETKVKAHTIVGKEPNKFTRTENWLDGLTRHASASDNINKVLGGEGNHDTIVPLESQRGGLQGDATTQVDGVIHATVLADAENDISETGSRKVWDEIAGLLLEKTDSSRFSNSLLPPTQTGPAEIKFGTACPANFQPAAPLGESASQAQATATLMPLQGTIARPGDEISISFSLTGGNPIEGVLFGMNGQLDAFESTGVVSFRYKIPSDQTGKLDITALTYGPGPDNYTLSTSVTVLPSSAPDLITAFPQNLLLTQIGQQQQLRVVGRFANSQEIDVTSGLAGTTYSTRSGSNLIVDVSAEGVIEARGAGQETILISNSSKTTELKVYVSTSGVSPNSIATTVLAASYSTAPLATEAIASAFGPDLANATQSATAIPLPTSLAGVTVKVRDSTGTERLAPLFYVSPTQINYQIPPGTSPGAAIVTVTKGNSLPALGTVQITTVSPGIFTASSDGQGVAAANAVRVKPGNIQIYEPVSTFDPVQRRHVATPIDLGPPTEQVFLLLYGTSVQDKK